jgi:hypothetical protein
MNDERLHCQGVDGPCFNDAINRRQNTAYKDDAMNWVTMCDECAEHNEKMWDAQWREYRSGCL